MFMGGVGECKLHVSMFATTRVALPTGGLCELLSYILSRAKVSFICRPGLRCKLRAVVHRLGEALCRALVLSGVEEVAERVLHLCRAGERVLACVYRTMVLSDPEMVRG